MVINPFGDFENRLKGDSVNICNIGLKNREKTTGKEKRWYFADGLDFDSTRRKVYKVYKIQ